MKFTVTIFSSLGPYLIQTYQNEYPNTDVEKATDVYSANFSSTCQYYTTPIGLICFVTIGYLTNPDPNKRIKCNMKLWKWVTLIMATIFIGVGTMLWGMLAFKEIEPNGTEKYTKVDWRMYFGNILVNGPGL